MDASERHGRSVDKVPQGFADFVTRPAKMFFARRCFPRSDPSRRLLFRKGSRRPSRPILVPILVSVLVPILSRKNPSPEHSAVSKRLRSTSARIRKPPRRNCCGFFIPPFFRAGTAAAAAAAAEFHRAASISSRSTSDAQLFAQDSCSSKSKIVAVFSTMRRNRNHAFNGTRRTVAPGKSLRSSATRPNPPPCSSKSAPRNACSMLLQRTSSNRPSVTPAASAPQGSNASRPSTTAHDSPAPRQSRQQGNQKAHASRAGRSGNFRQAAARQSAGEPVNFRNAASRHLRQRRVAHGKGSGDFSTQRIFELGAKSGESHGATWAKSGISFAFSSPVREFSSFLPPCQERFQIPLKPL